jgi:dienelactone hydrolase
MLKSMSFGLRMVCCLLAMTSCSSIQSRDIPSVRASVRCSADASNSYEVFIPERAKAETLPVLLVLDPHGDGASALMRFKPAAERYRVVLVASNTVRNNLAGYESVIGTLLSDVQSKYPCGKELYLSGFSGGARMALGYALQHPVQGLLLSGALAGAAELRQVACPLYAISGTDDFNFVETAQYLFQDATVPNNLNIELTASSHGWPDSLTLSDAFGFVRLAGSREAEPAVLDAFVQTEQTKLDRLVSEKSFIKARWLARNLSRIGVFDKEGRFGKQNADLSARPAYTDELQRLAENLKMEMSVREGYLQAFETKDAAWWKNEAARLDGEIKAATDPFRQDALRRIKGFWGIACYSLCNRAAAGNDRTTLARMVPIYRVLEPGNTDMLRFAALLGQ